MNTIGFSFTSNCDIPFSFSFVLFIPLFNSRTDFIVASKDVNGSSHATLFSAATNRGQVIRPQFFCLAPRDNMRKVWLLHTLTSLRENNAETPVKIKAI